MKTLKIIATRFYNLLFPNNRVHIDNPNDNDRAIFSGDDDYIQDGDNLRDNAPSNNANEDDHTKLSPGGRDRRKSIFINQDGDNLETNEGVSKNYILINGNSHYMNSAMEIDSGINHLGKLTGY
jgi:hypothetical protein